MDVARGVASRVTSRAGDERDPVWAPDGRSLAFAAMGADKGALRRKGLRARDPETAAHGDCRTRTIRSTGRATDRRSSSSAGPPTTPRASGRCLSTAARSSPSWTRGSAWTSRSSRPTSAGSPTSPRSPGATRSTWSPIRRDGDRVRVSVDGGGQPKWRGDGKELFYTTPGNLLMAVAVRASGERLEVSLPTRLFEIRGPRGHGLRRLRAERGRPALPGEAAGPGEPQAAAADRDELDVAAAVIAQPLGQRWPPGRSGATIPVMIVVEQVLLDGDGWDDAARLAGLPGSSAAGAALVPRGVYRFSSLRRGGLVDDEDDDRSARAPEPEDVVRICRALNEAGARYLLIGGFAVIAHGAGASPRTSTSWSTTPRKTSPS